MSWREFWNGTHSIYVNDRHRLLHYDMVANDIVALMDTPVSVVLDHGCGEASAAGAVAARAGTLYLYDAAPNVQEKLRQRFEQHSGIQVLSGEALQRLPKSSLDLIIVNSLLQYLTGTEFGGLLDFWHGKLKDSGRLVLADVIPPGVGPLTDVKALLGFAWRGGFMLAALRGLVVTFFSSYRKLRGQLGLAHYTGQQVAELGTAHGFRCERAARNIGHNQARSCFLLSKNCDSGPKQQADGSAPDRS